jgi:hypothetical protein
MKRLTIKCGKEFKLGKLTVRWVNDKSIAGADTRFSTHTLYHPSDVAAVAKQLTDTNWHIIMPAEVKRLDDDKDVVAKFRSVAPKGTREWTIHRYGDPWVVETMWDHQNYWCANGKGKAFTVYVNVSTHMYPSEYDPNENTALPILLVKNYPEYLDYRMTFGYSVWSSLSREHELWDYAAKLEKKFNEWGKDKKISCTTDSDHDDSAVVSFFITGRKSQYDTIEKFFEDQKAAAPYWVDYGIRGVYIRGV